MNTIRITYEAFRPEAEIELNGEPLDVLNETLSPLRKEFHLYAPALFRILDGYFGDAYTVAFTGTAYQCQSVRALSADAVHCAGVQTAEIALPYPEKTLLQALTALSGKYGMEFSGDADVAVTEDAEAPADLCFCAPDAIPQSFAARYLVCLSDKYAVYRAADRYILEIPAEMRDALIADYRFRCKVNPTLTAALKKLSASALTKEDAAHLRALRTGQPQFLLEETPAVMDVGDTCPLRLAVFPAEAADAFALEITPAGVLTLTDGTLTAAAGGTATLAVKDKSGAAVSSRTVTVKGHAFVQSIRLIPSFKYLLVNETGRLDAYVLPEDAEDADALKWTSSDTDVAQVTRDGRLVAFKAGECTITVSGREASTSFALTVKEELTGVTLSKTELTLKPEQDFELHCLLTPANAAVEDIVWENGNELVAEIKTSEDNSTCYVHPIPGKSGQCTVRCAVNGGRHEAACRIDILPPPNHDGHYTTAVILTVLGIVALGWLPMLLGFAGLLFSTLVPLIVCLAGLPHNSKRYGFKTLTVVNIVFAVIFLFLHYAMCAPMMYS